MAKKVFLFLADGFEEVEALTPVDYLRRAGIDVKTVSISENRTVTSARGVHVLADLLIADIADAGGSMDGLILPGGMPGAANLAASTQLDSLLTNANTGGKLLCAICAAPFVVLSAHNALLGRRWTSYSEPEPGNANRQTWLPDAIVTDGNLITGRAAGAAAKWSLVIIEKLLGAEAREKVEKAVML
jgi:4-methyl-5(b-hydroxyethyl)-thiazole monophosphate biosynthesis